MILAPFPYTWLLTETIKVKQDNLIYHLSGYCKLAFVKSFMLTFQALALHPSKWTTFKILTLMKRLKLEILALKLFAVADLHYQLS